MNATPIASSSRFIFGASRLSVRCAHSKSVPPRQRGWAKAGGPSGQPQGHGERIWLFNHEQANHVLYSFKRKLKAFQALKQIPFNGKKLKPASLRKDYWQPMALIQFAEGDGEVGRSVYQRLREFRKRHELEWGWQAPDFLAMGKRARGEALNDQKGNSVADIAAVLGGAGKGNKIRDEEAAGDEAAGRLQPVTIYWANERDIAYAREWTDNVTHVVGIPESFKDPEESLPEEAGVAEALSQTQTETTATA